MGSRRASHATTGVLNQEPTRNGLPPPTAAACLNSKCRDHQRPEAQARQGPGERLPQRHVARLRLAGTPSAAQQRGSLIHADPAELNAHRRGKRAARTPDYEEHARQHVAFQRAVAVRRSRRSGSGCVRVLAAGRHLVEQNPAHGW